MTVMVSAHQGGNETAPSGTWEAYRNALEIAADYVEFDVRKTRDGDLVAFHDARVGRDGPWVRDLTRAELCEAVGREVPPVAELMALLGGRTRGHVDIKEPGYEHETVTLALDSFGADSFVVTGEDLVVAAVKQAFPKVTCALSVGGGLFEGGLQARYGELYPRRRMLACGADALAVQHRYAGLTVLRMCERSGVEAMVWTVNDPARIRRFLADDRVSVLVTDRPAMALEQRRALTRRGG